MTAIPPSLTIQIREYLGYGAKGPVYGRSRVVTVHDMSLDDAAVMVSSLFSPPPLPPLPFDDIVSGFLSTGYNSMPVDPGEHPPRLIVLGLHRSVTASGLPAAPVLRNGTVYLVRTSGKKG